jgi:hypothetical protein
MKKFYFLIPILLLLTYCTEKPRVQEDKFILVYTDLMFAQDTVLINTDNVDSLKTEVFIKHNISEEDYQQTIEFYNNSPGSWEKFFVRVEEYIESLKSKPGEP